MAFNISLEVYGVNEIIQWVDALPVKTQKQAFVIFNRWGKQMVRLGEKLSPRDKLRGIDPRRRPEKESFALQWHYDVKMVGDGVELDVGNLDERMRFIIHDTKPRTIPRGGAAAQFARGYPMRFFWRGAWHKAWQIYGGVAAHGTKGKPVHEWILEEFDVDSHLHDIAGGIR